MRQRKVKVLFPLGGLVRNTAYQNQPPYSSPDCQNVRPFDVIKERERGGSRPGLSKAFYQQLGSGNPVRMMNSVTSIKSDGFTIFSDGFTGAAFGSAWEAIGSFSLPSILEDETASISGAQEVRAARESTTFDTTQDYSFSIFIVPWQASHQGEYSLYGMMDASSPDPENNGFVAKLTMTDNAGTASCTLTKYASGASTSIDSGSGTGTFTQAGWFTVLVSGTTVTAYWLGEQLATGTISGLSGTRVGFGMKATNDNGVCLVNKFTHKYYRTTTEQRKQVLFVASSNGLVYKESDFSDLTQITTDYSLVADRMILSEERLQKLYIADHEDPVEKGTDGTVTGTTFDATSVSDWTANNPNTDDYVIEIYNGLGGTADGVYSLDTIAAGSLTLDSAPGDGTCAFRLLRCPKIYDPSDDTVSQWTATTGKGATPQGCPLIALYRDRLVLAGAPSGPHLWYMSRQGDPLDWDYGQTDAQAAVAGQNSDAGRIGQTLTALVSHSDDYLIFGCPTSLWILRGDPASGGIIDNLSRTVGIVDKRAWCLTPEGMLVFLSRDGIYGINPGGMSFPESISREILPKELIDVDVSQFTVTMAYDVRDRGIHICLQSNNDSTTTHWWFDWRMKNFWPVDIPSDSEPTSIFEYFSELAQESSVMFGSADGFIRKFDSSFETDDGTEISSYVKIGPINLGGDFNEGQVRELFGTVAQGSGDVRWDIYVAETAEEALTASSFTNGTWTEGQNYNEHPRARGSDVIFKLTNNEERKWAFSSMATIFNIGGRHRLG